jgi:hypothetical protein
MKTSFPDSLGARHGHVIKLANEVQVEALEAFLKKQPVSLSLCPSC